MYTAYTLCQLHVHWLPVNVDMFVSLSCAPHAAFRVNTHVEGFRLPILGPDLWFPDGCEVGAAHCQQSATTVGMPRKGAEEEQNKEEEQCEL